MTSLEIPQSLKDFCWDILKEHNLGERHSFNGSKEDQYLGLLGEYMTALILQLPVEFKPGFDGGYDLLYNGYKIDVKTMGRTVDPKPHYVNNFLGYQEKLECDLLMFCSINKKTSVYTLCGWIFKTEFLEVADYFPIGEKRKRDDGSVLTIQAPLYEIKNSQLRTVHTNKIKSPDSTSSQKSQ
jgi:hypothetical protein